MGILPWCRISASENVIQRFTVFNQSKDNFLLIQSFFIVHIHGLQCDNFFLFFFGGTGVRTQGLGATTQATPQPTVRSFDTRTRKDK
jgi:hypothetical protein